jgi:hypothetical protein
VLFDDEEGNTRVRILNTEEVADVIKDSEDRQRTQFSKVKDLRRKYNFVSDSYDVNMIPGFMYYADVNNFNPEDFSIPELKRVNNAKIYHLKINCDINDKFGIPVLYRGIDWIRAHKEMSEDLATLIKSLSMLAWKKKVKGTPAQVNALKAALHSRLDFTNKVAAAGSVQYENEAIDTQPINTPTGGVVIGKEGLRQLKLMVCAASGLFEHYFGDPSTGNLATATSMELPMVKKFASFQTLWTGVINDILQRVINNKIDVGLLSGKSEFNEKTGRMEYETDIDRTIDIDFPPIIEKDLKVVGEALEIARRNNLISDETAARLFLMAANQNNIDEEIKKIDFSRDMMSRSIFGMDGFGGGGFTPKKEEPKKTEEKPVKEAIETPEKDPAVKITKKNNYLLQRMNGYRRALAMAFIDFRKKIIESSKSAGTEGKIVGNVDDLQEHLEFLKNAMVKSAESYFPVAVDIGKKYLQAHLKNVRESLFEAQGRERSLLAEKLGWNEKYVSESLIPDIEKSILAAVRMPYKSDSDFTKAVSAAVSSYESRIEQYAGAFWHVEEAAVKDAGRGTGLQVNFVGADDESTCKGCAEAMAGNPYLIDEAPEPGSHECDGRCRHALQII